MKVKDLIKKLQKIDPDKIVVLSSDSEGNSFSTVGFIDANLRYKDGEVGVEKLTAGLRDSGYSDEDVMIGGKSAVVLYP